MLIPINMGKTENRVTGHRFQVCWLSVGHAVFIDRTDIFPNDEILFTDERIIPSSVRRPYRTRNERRCYDDVTRIPRRFVKRIDDETCPPGAICSPDILIENFYRNSLFIFPSPGWKKWLFPGDTIRATNTIGQDILLLLRETDVANRNIFVAWKRRS